MPDVFVDHGRSRSCNRRQRDRLTIRVLDGGLRSRCGLDLARQLPVISPAQVAQGGKAGYAGDPDHVQNQLKLSCFHGTPSIRRTAQAANSRLEPILPGTIVSPVKPRY